MSDWKARPTTYRGIQMRSRLEARFAATLDKLVDALDGGARWEYEPRAFANERGQYLPDFAIYTEVGTSWFIEVRPHYEGMVKALAPMQIILDSEPDATLWVVSPVGSYWRMGGESWQWTPA